MGACKVADVPSLANEPLREAEAFHAGAVGTVRMGEGRGSSKGTGRKLASITARTTGIGQIAGRFHKIERMTWER